MKRSKEAAWLSCVALSFLLSSCCLPTVGPVAPRPTISLARSTRSLALRLSPAIKDRFHVPWGSSTHRQRFIGFRRSLAYGFAASFRPFFNLVDDNADLTLHIESARVEINQRGRLILRFAARLDDRALHTLGRSFGSMASTSRWVSEESLAEVLTLMYEKVAMDCFVSPSMRR